MFLYIIYFDKYISAAGKTVKAFSGWYGIAWDIGVTIYESDRFIIDHYHSSYREYKMRERKYENDRTNWNRRLMDNAFRTFCDADKRFQKLQQEKKYR